MLKRHNIRKVLYILPLMILTACNPSSGDVNLTKDLMEYKEPETKVNENNQMQIEEYISKANALKKSGSWDLKGTEYKDMTYDNSKSREPYKRGENTTTDEKAWKDSLEPKVMKPSGILTPFMSQPMSDRMRLVLAVGNGLYGNPYSQADDRLDPFSGHSDCSGTMWLMYNMSGTKLNATYTGAYPGEVGKTIIEVNDFDKNPNWNGYEVGDILWYRRGGDRNHVEMYIGKKDGQMYIYGTGGEKGKGPQLKQFGVPFHWNPKKFQKAYRVVGRDNPLKASEIEKIKSAGLNL